MKLELLQQSQTSLALMMVLSLVTGVVATRIIKQIKWRLLVRKRVNEVFQDKTPVKETVLLKERADSPLLTGFGAPTLITRLAEEADLKAMSAADLTLLCAGGALIAALGTNLLDGPLWLSLVLFVLFLTVPFGILKLKAMALRKKFQEQLPDGIDLMVSVLRSGHSLPQSVRAIASDCPSPLKDEFAHIDQRMNLGLPLGEALAFSQDKYRLTELDLIRRAVTIQTEVGGSLAELLEKTNSTLRQRLKLKRQVRVLTTQSRLTGLIVALLPLILAFALETLSPGYLRPLFQKDTGKLLLMLAAFLQVLGMFLMKKLTEVKA
ncbi:MAG TPA: type II secretion system F family protein [Candidatus Obscuribacter sp.]|nr:type II secretion system F family protein [Candidatus Obscuribacter sp.]